MNTVLTAKINENARGDGYSNATAQNQSVTTRSATSADPINITNQSAQTPEQWHRNDLSPASDCRDVHCS